MFGCALYGRFLRQLFAPLRSDYHRCAFALGFGWIFSARSLRANSGRHRHRNTRIIHEYVKRWFGFAQQKCRNSVGNRRCDAD
jgi:hypothetical protein